MDGVRYLELFSEFSELFLIFFFDFLNFLNFFNYDGIIIRLKYQLDNDSASLIGLEYTN